MIIIDFHKPVLDLKDQPIVDESGEAKTLADILQEAFSVDIKVNAMKFIPWARTLAKGSSLLVDKEDFKSIRDFIESHQRMSGLLKYNIITAMDDAEDAYKKSQQTF